MAGKKSKKFRVATEGATADGRVIERDHILQMAKNYDPAKYQATVNMEHIKSAYPGGPFGNYGLVNGLETADNADGKAELFATITPTDDLVAMTDKLQKVFTSIEINPKFADTGEAYMVGLAVTDNPASLGTELLAFSAANPAASPLTARKQHADNCFTAATETVMEFVAVEPEGPGFLEKFRAIFAKKATSDEARFNAVQDALEQLAEHGAAQTTQAEAKLKTVEESLTAAQKTITTLTSRLTDLEGKFNNTPANGPKRPVAVGDGEAITDC